MPFTPAHALAAVPLARGRFVFSALVIGTMVPDFSKIITLSPAVHFGHSWSGILWFCTPVGLVLLWIYHSILKFPLFALLPQAHQQRVYPWLKTQSLTTNVGWSTVSVATGAATHLVWDAFTHAHGVGVTLFPVLKAPVYQSQTGAIPLYKLLQHGSTLAGLSALPFIYASWLKKAPACDVPANSVATVERGCLVWRMLLVAFVLALLAGLYQAYGTSGIRWLQLFAGRAAVTMMAVLAMELLIFSIWFQIFRRKQ